jgi:Tat protein translocase TatB subunit
MFGIGMVEMVLIVGVALIVIGPKQLPDLARTLGRAVGEFRCSASGIKDTLQKEANFGEVEESLQMSCYGPRNTSPAETGTEKSVPVNPRKARRISISAKAHLPPDGVQVDG